MKHITGGILPLSLSLALAACGGGQATSSGQEPVRSSTLLAASRAADVIDTPAASDYFGVVQQLYFSYFGRPADPDGLVNFENELLAVRAPSDINELIVSYRTDSRVRALVDSFGNSAESQALYGSGNDEAFITAIYTNLLNRAPQAEGLAFWKQALGSGALTRGGAALFILAGAMSNTSAQGQMDARTIASKMNVATSFFAAIDTPSEQLGYMGSDAAASVRAMLRTVTADTDLSTFVATTVIPTLSSLYLQNPSFYNLGECFELTPGVEYQTSDGYRTRIVQEAFDDVEMRGRARIGSGGTRVSVAYENAADSYISLPGGLSYDDAGAIYATDRYASEAKIPLYMPIGRTASTQYMVSRTGPVPQGIVATRNFYTMDRLAFLGFEDVTLGGRTFTNACRLQLASRDAWDGYTLLWRAKGFGYIKTMTLTVANEVLTARTVELTDIVAAP